MERENDFSFGAHGRHRAWTEGNDVVHLRWHGDVSVDGAKMVPKVFDLLPNASQGFFLILHVAEQGKFSPGARDMIRKDPRSSWTREIIVVGASFRVRVMLGMISKALAVLRARATRMYFVESEADVPAQIARMRREWAEQPRRAA